MYMDIPDYGFIILRHVRDEQTNLYWQLSYDSIRNVYPDVKIVIIDDNSDKKYLTQKELTNAEVIEGEYPGRGELLPYIYYSRHQFFKKAVIIHDSVFVNKELDIDSVVSHAPLVWFDHRWNNDVQIRNKLQVFKCPELINFYNSKRWLGGLGAMTIITYESLAFVNRYFNFELLIPVIKNRDDRIDFERILGCLMYFTMKASQSSVYGYTHNYCPWGLPFTHRHLTSDRAFTKVFTGR